MNKKSRKQDMKRSAFLKKLDRLWPVAKGSLSEVRKSCMRKNCPACERGEKHPATIFTYWKKGKHYCMYVPKAIVPQIGKSLRNGRKLEELMKQIGPELIKGYRQRKRERR